MIKLDIVNRVAERTGVPKMKAEQAVDALFHSMKEALARGERIELRGFGVFVVKPRKRGDGRNPRTGEEVAIPSGKTIRFKPGKELQAPGFDCCRVAVAAPSFDLVPTGPALASLCPTPSRRAPTWCRTPQGLPERYRPSLPAPPTSR